MFDPVSLEGTTVKRASLCNISECERLGIGGKGTVLSVIKANKIIPKIVNVTKSKGAFEVPDVCPVCGSRTEIIVSPQSGTKTLRCTNPSCAAKQLKKFTRFVSKSGMDIDGISEQTLDRFVNEGWIREYADIFKLVEHRDEIAELDGFGEKSADKIVASIEKARNATDKQTIYALCIPLVGHDVTKKLLTAYSFTELFETAKTAADENIFANIDGIGPEKSAAFVSWVKDPENSRVLNNLLKEVTVQTSVKEPSGAKCAGLTFVVTGDVHVYQNRNELKAYIESQGGKVSGSVSKNTAYLINNNSESTSGKNKKAKELGIPIITEDEFIAKFK